MVFVQVSAIDVVRPTDDTLLGYLTFAFFSPPFVWLLLIHMCVTVRGTTSPPPLSVLLILLPPPFSSFSFSSFAAPLLLLPLPILYLVIFRLLLPPSISFSSSFLPPSYHPLPFSTRDAISRGIVIVAAMQCVKGSIQLSSYDNGLELQRIGVISAGDMSVEATYAKLCYLLGKGYSQSEITTIMPHNIRGETVGHRHSCEYYLADRHLKDGFHVAAFDDGNKFINKRRKSLKDISEFVTPRTEMRGGA
eukprot:GHVU01212154.1.p1 GENE.GHVU01212154.1~~GHVU01212154.1.p1  ORF type:complete len:249 (+),score=23.03 GHVU01212154.1:351-1097(+)